jgi:PHD/YefM family antitoxin component YafN of YafNO toxin-antitoxin module
VTVAAETLVTVSEVRVRLNELIQGLAERPAVLLKHGKPVAALLSFTGYQKLLDKIEDLEDRLEVMEAKAEPLDMSVPLEKVEAEAGLLVE